MCTVPVARRFCRESYNEPLAVYETLKRRGMDLVTVTDHDSVGALGELACRPDFFLSEEVTCTTPSGTRLHVGVYDITEKQHLEIQRRRDDLLSLAAWLSEQRLFFTINHAFSSLTGSRTDEDFDLFERYFPGVETLNGHMLDVTNRLSATLAARLGKAPVAGSDAHTMAHLGRTYTEVKGARTKGEFLEGVRQGAGLVFGERGDYAKLTRTVLEICGLMMRERAWTRCLAPVVLAVPAATFINCVREAALARRFGHRAGGFEPRPWGGWLPRRGASEAAS
jgi:predicted metal-dependent phosphoesterase TrpH